MKKVNKLMIAAVMALAIPTGALAAEADLQVKIDKLTQELDSLKGKVERVEDKSLGKWLSIGGSYQFRVDNLRGKTVAYSDAIGTMSSLVGNFIAAPSGTVAGTSYISGVTVGYNGTIDMVNPTATQFMMMGKAGVLFTPDQFNAILNNYMPTAMYGSFNTVILPALMTPGFDPDAYLQANPLTSQQQQILATLAAKVMPTVLGMMGPAAATTFQNLPQNMQQAAMVMALQGFLGSSSGNLADVSASKPKNMTLYTNKFALDLKAKATKDVTVNVKLGMYKVFGSQDNDATANSAFADRVGVFDGVLGHVPSNSYLNVDRAYATWSNIADEPLWFSVGRRPATDGAPTNLKNNNERPGNGGTPALLVNYAFDGMTLGYAPDIEMLPGFYAKVCYGRGFESGFKTESTNSVKDTDMLGVAVIPVDTDPLRVWLQWNRGFNIFDFPVMKNTIFGDTAPATNLGSIDWYGAGAMTTLKDMGPGALNAFADFGVSVTHPNSNVSQNAGFQGLMSGAFFAQDFAPKDQTGYGVLAGLRYDLPSKTKIGFEYNYGSKYWITFAPAADDMWTSKVGTRGQVFEPYVIQELDLKPISSNLAKAFFKLGYQYYDFKYTGSNNWVGEPVKISDIKATDLMLMAPVKSAQNFYGTFEVHF